MRKTAVPEQLRFSPQALKKLIVPLLIEQTLAMAVGTVDTIMISSAGEAAVSGVSLVDMLNIVIIAMFSALATGGAVVTAQLLGAGKTDRSRDSVQQLLAVSLAFSAVMTALLLLLREPIMGLLFGTAEADVWESAMTYLKITALSFPCIALYNAGAALFRAVGNSRVAMLTSLLSNGINLVGNSVFLFVCHWGVFGVALATLIARFAAMGAVLLLLTRKHQPITWEPFRRFRPDWELVRRILAIGIPSSLENSLFNLGKILLMSLVTSFGTVQIAANAVGNNFASLGCIPGSAMNLATLTVVGQCVGARDEAQVRYYARKLLRLTYLIGGIVNIILCVTMPLTIRIYSISQETARLAIKLVLIHNGFAVLLWPASFSVPCAFRAANDAVFPMVVSTVSMVVFRILFSYILGRGCGMGVVGVWLSMIIDWVFRSACFAFRSKSGRWLRKMQTGKTPSVKA